MFFFPPLNKFGVCLDHFCSGAEIEIPGDPSFASASASQRSDGPCVSGYSAPGSGAWLGKPLGPTSGGSGMLATGPWSGPWLSRPLPLASPALPGRVSQAEMRWEETSKLGYLWPYSGAPSSLPPLWAWPLGL